MTKRRIEEFELGDSLGVGTVGTIYRAKDLTHDREVALKLLLPAVSGDPMIKARFEREMLILEKLSHPHIVQYYGGGQDQGQLFYAMELVDGGTLKDILRDSGRLSFQEAITCGVQIASALQHAHNHGVIHRDLKPANLFLTTEGTLKLGDFGIARDTHAADITSDGLTVGTYAYMSPEQITGDKSVSGKTDLYALGCLLFEMLTGRPPYEGENFAQLFEQHLRSEPPRVRDFAPSCPQSLDNLIHEMLNKSPEARPFNARSIQAKLMEMLDQAIDAPLDDESRDVAAAQALDRARVALGSRLKQIREIRDSRNVSWLSLALLLLVVVGVVCASLCFGA